MALLRRSVAALLIVALSALVGGCDARVRTLSTSKEIATLEQLPWDSVVARARGSRVLWRLWRGDPAINAYVDRWVAPRLKARFDITLEAVDGQGPEIVNALVTEREAGRDRGLASLVWINGETFAELRQERLLAGPWSGRLPNARYVDSASSYVARDFEQDPAGYESPWGTVQFALIYDTVRTPSPPRTVTELGAWIRSHPGRFTHDQGFAGMTLLKTLMYALSGGVQQFQGGFDNLRYASGRDTLFAWLRQLSPYFWRHGATYPPDGAAMHRLFANREIDFTMSNNQNEVVSKMRDGVLPPTSRALLLRDGMIANTHYLGIPFNASNPAAAMVVADFLLAPEAQFEKQRPEVWADGTVLELTRIPQQWRERFATLAADRRVLSPDSLRLYARPEVVPAYHEHLVDDWRRLFRTGAP